MHKFIKENNRNIAELSVASNIEDKILIECIIKLHEKGVEENEIISVLKKMINESYCNIQILKAKIECHEVDNDNKHT
jgi:hypothetical protein